MGVMHRAEALEAETREKQARLRERYTSTLEIAAAVIAAVRLAREPEVSKMTPRVAAAIGEAVSLAQAILSRVAGTR